jgi:hypothetical protein
MQLASRGLVMVRAVYKRDVVDFQDVCLEVRLIRGCDKAYTAPPAFCGTLITVTEPSPLVLIIWLL